MKQRLKIGTLMLLMSTLVIFSWAEAGNVKKVYVNVAKEGQTAQASDIPANYNQVDTKLKTIAYDLAKGRLGTLNSTVMTNEGLQFNGTNGVNLGTDKAFNQIQELTLEVWMKTPVDMGYTWRGLIGKQGVDRDYNFYAGSCCYPWNGEKRVTFLHFSSARFGHSAFNLPTPFEPGTWHHVALTVDKAGLQKYYADGKKYAQFQGTPGIANNNWPVYIGQTDNIWNGLIKEVRIWNVARTEDQIEDNMEVLHDFNKNLIAYFKFVS